MFEESFGAKNEHFSFSIILFTPESQILMQLVRRMPRGESNDAVKRLSTYIHTYKYIGRLLLKPTYTIQNNRRLPSH